MIKRSGLKRQVTAQWSESEVELILEVDFLHNQTPVAVVVGKSYIIVFHLPNKQVAESRALFLCGELV